jgi:photosystem II stability/assembly factor-like uncharacterized protein
MTHPTTDVDAGVIEDARARQRRQRWVGALIVLIVAALVAGLIAGFGGGGGAGATRHGQGGSAGAGAAARGASEVAQAVTGTPPFLGLFGVLAPGVGWAANGVGFYMTRDSGRSWTEAAVPGLSGEDVVADLVAAASPNSDHVVLSFTDGRAAGSCKPPATPAEGAGAVARTSDGGRSWRTQIMPGCVLAVPLSFVSAKVGFALAGPGPSLYETTDGGQRWRRVGGELPFRSVTFATVHDGWAITSTRLGNRANGVGALYRTADGGRTWRRAPICHGTTVVCQPPSFFGRYGVVPATEEGAGGLERVLVYATADGGRTWESHAVTTGAHTRRLVPFSAPSAQDLFVIFKTGLYVSVDGGHSWSRRPTPGNADWGEIDFVNSNYGWYGGNHLDYTTDGGRNWKRIGSR